MVQFSFVFFAVVAAILLFISMVFSAMASSDAKKSCPEAQTGCHKWSKVSALVTGLTLVVALVGIIVFLTHKPVIHALAKAYIPEKLTAAAKK